MAQAGTETVPVNSLVSKPEQLALGHQPTSVSPQEAAEDSDLQPLLQHQGQGEPFSAKLWSLTLPPSPLGAGGT